MKPPLVASDSFLHALVATLSTGPVGFSDALGYENASLILRTCRPDGLLLKPTLPLAAIDRSFHVGDASLSVAVPAGGHVWATHTAAANEIWFSVHSEASDSMAAVASSTFLV